MVRIVKFNPTLSQLITLTYGYITYIDSELCDGGIIEYVIARTSEFELLISVQDIRYFTEREPWSDDKYYTKEFIINGKPERVQHWLLNDIVNAYMSTPWGVRSLDTRTTEDINNAVNELIKNHPVKLVIRFINDKDICDREKCYNYYMDHMYVPGNSTDDICPEFEIARTFMEKYNDPYLNSMIEEYFPKPIITKAAR